jgi:hypothetical protein
LLKNWLASKEDIKVAHNGKWFAVVKSLSYRA